jgi:ribosomal protein S18 acetylase RimI-like enzyme
MKLPAFAPIVPVTKSDAADTTVCIAAAFTPLAVSQWLVPDPQIRTSVLIRNFRFWVDQAVAHGEVYRVASSSPLDAAVRASAVWFKHLRPHTDATVYDTWLEHACGRHADRFRQLDEAFAHAHAAAPGPHHYLMFLAAAPADQRRGLGSALLDDYHARLDQQHLGAYLDAADERSRDLYLRHGYRDIGRPFDLPDGGPRMWPMWRDPQDPLNWGLQI